MNAIVRGAAGDARRWAISASPNRCCRPVRHRRPALRLEGIQGRLRALPGAFVSHQLHNPLMVVHRSSATREPGGRKDGLPLRYATLATQWSLGDVADPASHCPWRCSECSVAWWLSGKGRKGQHGYAVPALANRVRASRLQAAGLAVRNLPRACDPFRGTSRRVSGEAPMPALRPVVTSSLTLRLSPPLLRADPRDRAGLGLDVGC
jgi:hypothetical protein